MPILKNYSADLKRIYKRSFEISLTVTLAIIIAAFKFSPSASKSSLFTEPIQEIINIENIINTVQKPEIPPPPKAPLLIATTMSDVPEDIILDDIDEIKPVQLPANPPSRPNVVDDITIFEVVEEMPAPIGGLKSIQEKVHYPEIARKAGIEGIVFIVAKIDKNGNVVEATVLKGLGGGLDEEALNAIQLTKFIPGKQRGKAVNVKMVIPIKFVLK